MACAVSGHRIGHYLDLYLDAEQAGAAPAELAPRLEALLDQVDDFLPLYLLYTSVAIDAYEFMGDSGYLDRLQEHLATGSRRANDAAGLDKAWFDLYRAQGDIESATQKLEAIVARDPDPALESYLRGELQAADHNFA